MAAEQLSVSVFVPLAPERAWALYTDPAAITRWNFASDDWHCPSAQVDLVVGGQHSARMEAKDGSFGFDFGGVYSEVDPPHALTLVLGDGRRSRTTFVADAAGTRVETRFDAESQNPPELQRQGWQAILDNYRRLAEQVAAAP
ncbi:SRPBCC domain-containing protein [Sandarakinorhabdus oryzae]|uniref:SRPBCC domain-containing protein n=1 Tax=Sandarakinorhabdus oryzae TaxID=2675220 RepID=UPI0012E1540A|nr:SRPBCC domain-containing protein [Sandarakinorhabdus oryzae]